MGFELLTGVLYTFISKIQDRHLSIHIIEYFQHSI